MKWLVIFVSAALVLSATGAVVAHSRARVRAEAAVQAALSTLDEVTSVRERVEARAGSSEELLGATLGEIDDDGVRQELRGALDHVRSVLAREPAAPEPSAGLAEALVAGERAQAYLTELSAAADAVDGATEAVNAAHASWVLRKAVGEHAAGQQALADAVASAERLMATTDGRVADESVRDLLQSQIDAASAALRASVDDSDAAALNAQTQMLAEALKSLQEATTSTEDAEAAWTAAQSATEAARTPIGGLRVLGAGDGWGYGQGFPSGNCANWKIGLVNQSDTPITQITFAPPGGSYAKVGDVTDEVDAKTPSAAVIAIYLPPGATQDVGFQTCTGTPVPSGGYEFGATAPDSVRFTWSTGDKGVASFGW
ncbi:hypothetical protein Q6346_07840 [Isoptericola sp. b490]|uniref:hypothetical protein n=1 Tax=Actinotalea lenta TaxID=3064654 RepID=UPI0027143131|nr:hypothetical protein [Isoptericola sp. b490]MDO8121221.1 hypothetical protein [Isoptericola sp. b490]